MSIVLALTSYHSSSSPGVESNQSKCDMFRPYYVSSDKLTGEATRSERKLSNLMPALIRWTLESHQLSQQFALSLIHI